MLIACLFSRAYAETATNENQDAVTETKLQTTVANLERTHKSVELKQKQLHELKDTLKITKDASEKQEYEQKIIRIVDFSEAGASSLDYRIYMVLNGSAAKAYYHAQRLLAQACVATCNREGRVIPFTQITVHSGNGGANPEQLVQTSIESAVNIR